MTDIEELFKRSAEWQATQKDLPYPEKIRQAEAFRESLIILKKSFKPSPSCSAGETETEGKQSESE